MARMSDVIELSKVDVLFQPLNIMRYVPDISEAVTHSKQNLFTELEKVRELSSDSSGKTALFNTSCFNCDSTPDGQIMSKVHYKDFHIFATVCSLQGYPYSIKISNEDSTIDFSLSDLSEMCLSMNKSISCLIGDCPCVSCFFDDQNVTI